MTSSFWDSDPHVKWGSLSESHVRIPANGSQAKTPARGGRLQYHNSVGDRELSLQLHFFVAKKCRLATILSEGKRS